MSRHFASRFSLASILLAGTVVAPVSCTTPKNLQVTVETSLGNFVIELYPDKAPETVKNFLAYIEDGSYTNTVFHRVMQDFVIQGGGMDENLKAIETHPSVKNEADNGLKNDIGTVAMARTHDPHSASSQFFINLKDNDFLNYQEKSPTGWGYCVFGKVIDGMDVVEKIAAVEVKNIGGHQNVPLKPVFIKKISPQV